MERTVFEVIQNKIASVSSQAIATFNDTIGTSLGAEMYRLGFTSSVSVVKDRDNVNEEEVLRARMIRYFGNKVMYEGEVNKLCKRYNLVTLKADRFVDHIPVANQREILEFTQRVKDNKLNQGRLETDLYHLPITDPFLVTAPPDCFRKAINTAEMSPEELEMWLEEDPIVWKRIWKFKPLTSDNVPTKMLLLVTAWGLEATLINNN